MSLRLDPVAAVGNGRHCDHEMITVCVRWSVTYKLSYRDLANLRAERGSAVAPTTSRRWVQRDLPEFEKRGYRYARPVGTSWRLDETFLTRKGQWGYLSRGVDKEGQTLDFFLREHREIAAAKQFLPQALATRGIPPKITLDGDAASPEAGGALQKEGRLPAELKVRTNKYLNNLLEQDQRRVKQRVRPLPGVKDFKHASLTIAGIELIHQIKKDHFAISTLCPARPRTPHVGEAVLAA